MAQGIDWLRAYVDQGAQVPVSERRVVLFRCDGAVHPVDVPEPPESPGTLLGPDMEWYEVEVPRYVLAAHGAKGAAGEQPSFTIERVLHRQTLCVPTRAADQEHGRYETIARAQRQTTDR